MKQKKDADRKKYVRVSDILPGDKVLLKVPSKSKMMPVYDQIPYTVVSKRGKAVTAQRDHPAHTVTRNTSFFKKLWEEDKRDNDKTERYGDADELEFSSEMSGTEDDI